MKFRLFLVASLIAMLLVAVLRPDPAPAEGSVSVEAENASAAACWGVASGLSGYSGTGYRTCDATGSPLMFSFDVPEGETGSAALYGFCDSSTRRVRWRIDGGGWTFTTFTGPGVSWCVPSFATAGNLAAGTHTFEVEWVSNAKAHVDRILLQTTTPEPTTTTTSTSSSTTTTAPSSGYQTIMVYPPANTRGIEIMVPAVRTGPAVMFLHGTGGNLASGVPELRPSYESWLANGWVVYSPALAARWGNDESMDRLVGSWEYVRDAYAITKQVVYGQSMGGLNGLNAITLTDVPIEGWAGNSPATNLAWAYTRSVFQKQINNAYGISGTNPYSTATAGHDPQLHPASDFAEVPFFRFYASPDDGSVWKSQNTDLMAAKLADSGLFSEAAVVVCSGGHLSANHYRAADVTDFFERTLA